MTVSPHSMAVEDQPIADALDDRVQAVPASSGKAVKLYVAELRQLFDPLDPRPCRERPLDFRAHDLIVERGRDLPRHRRTVIGPIARFSGRAQRIPATRKGVRTPLCPHGLIGNCGENACVGAILEHALDAFEQGEYALLLPG